MGMGYPLFSITVFVFMSNELSPVCLLSPISSSHASTGPFCVPIGNRRLSSHVAPGVSFFRFSALLPSPLEPEVQNAELMIAYQVPAGYKMLSQSFTDSIARAELAANPFSEKRVAIYLDTLKY